MHAMEMRGARMGRALYLLGQEGQRSDAIHGHGHGRIGTRVQVVVLDLERARARMALLRKRRDVAHQVEAALPRHAPEVAAPGLHVITCQRKWLASGLEPPSSQTIADIDRNASEVANSSAAAHRPCRPWRAPKMG